MTCLRYRPLHSTDVKIYQALKYRDRLPSMGSRRIPLLVTVEMGTTYLFTTAINASAAAVLALQVATKYKLDYSDYTISRNSVVKYLQCFRMVKLSSRFKDNILHPSTDLLSCKPNNRQPQSVMFSSVSGFRSIKSQHIICWPQRRSEIFISFLWFPTTIPSKFGTP